MGHNKAVNILEETFCVEENIISVPRVCKYKEIEIDATSKHGPEYIHKHL